MVRERHHLSHVAKFRYRSGFMGECDKDQSFAMLDTFVELGGNFLDTYVGLCAMNTSISLFSR